MPSTDLQNYTHIRMESGVLHNGDCELAQTQW